MFLRFKRDENSFKLFITNKEHVEIENTIQM